MFELKGKTALVTGASRGLGSAMAIALAEAGADIIGTARGDCAGLKEAVTVMGRRCEILSADLSDEKQVIDASNRAVDLWEGVDILVNNAGVTIVEPTLGYSLENYEKTMNINVKAVFLMTQIVGEHMKKKGSGKIINIGSIQSLIGTYDNMVYVGSKHAIAGMTKCLGNDWGRYGINANMIAPGFMMTDNTAKLRARGDAYEEIRSAIPMKRWGEPKDLVGPVVFLASSASDYVNGHTLVVDGGYINS